MTKSVITSIHLELSLDKRLDKAALNLHRSRNWLISEAIRKYLEQLENPNLAQETNKDGL